MLPLKILVWKAATYAATDPRVQRQAVKVYKAHVEPRAKDAWTKAKPKLEEKRAAVRNATRDTSLVRHPIEFAGKARKALRTPPGD